MYFECVIIIFFVLSKQGIYDGEIYFETSFIFKYILKQQIRLIFTITIILQLIQTDQQLLPVADCLPTLALDTCCDCGTRANFNCCSIRLGQKRREGGRGSGKSDGRVIESDNIDFLSALTLLTFGDGTHSKSPTNHYESVEPDHLLTVVFDTCDYKSKGMITVTGDDAPECPSYVIGSIFVLIFFSFYYFCFLFFFFFFVSFLYLQQVHTGIFHCVWFFMIDVCIIAHSYDDINFVFMCYFMIDIIFVLLFKVNIDINFIAVLLKNFEYVLYHIIHITAIWVFFNPITSVLTEKKTLMIIIINQEYNVYVC